VLDSSNKLNASKHRNENMLLYKKHMKQKIQKILREVGIFYTCLRK